MKTVSWITLLTPVVGPILTALAKQLAPKIPSWLVPIIAVLLGAGSNLIANNMAGGEVNVLNAALLGLSGIGVREATKHFNPLSKTKESSEEKP